MDLMRIFGMKKGSLETHESPVTEFESFLKQISHPDREVFAGHLIENVVDEIALEGLDGITLQALKIRLMQRPSLEIEDFEDIAPALWSQMKVLKHLIFYYLPCSRPDLIPYSWDTIRDEKGNPYEPLYAPEEIYPYFPVEDKSHGIRGSCESYETRSDISRVARSISYHDAIKLFGNHLVIVADQTIREKALFGENYKKHQSLSIVQYCIMERVGRARYAGETTRGKVSFQCLKIQPKTLFYNRKSLLKAGIVTKQAASMKFANCKCPAAITVFHLPRFYRRIESIANLNIRQIFSYLNNAEGKCIPVEAIIAKYGKHTLRNLQAQFPTLLEAAYEQEILPVQNEEDGLGIPEKKKKPRTIRVLRLKVTDINIQNQMIKRVMEGLKTEDDGNAEGGEGSGNAESEDADEGGTVQSSNSFSDVKALRSEHAFQNITDSCRLYTALIRAGTSGLKQMDLTNYLKMTSLEARSAVRFLCRQNLCKEGILKMQKQKAFTYTLGKFVKEDLEIKLSLEGQYQNVLEQMKNLRKAIYEETVGRALPPLSKIEANLVEPGTESASQVVEATPDSSPSKQTACPKKSSLPPAKIKVSSAPSSSRSMKSQKMTKSGNKGNDQDVENLSSSLSKAIESMPIPTLCLVKTEALRDVESESMEEGEEPMVPLIPQPSIVIPIGLIGPPTTLDSNGGRQSLVVPEPVSVSENEPNVIDTAVDEDDGLSDGDMESVQSSKVDPVDEQIRKKMVRQRVDWNDRDDRFILLAFIASILFIPKYNFSRIFIFNSTQIRDLMQKKSGGLSNKTSSAIRRRLHFLMHQKDRSFYEMWIGLLNHAVRDESLYVNYVKINLQPPQQKIYFSIPDSAFEKVYDYLREKFEGKDLTRDLFGDVRGCLNGIEALLFLRQLKRAEFYWNAMLFTVFCPVGNNSHSRKRFRVFWKSVVSKKKFLEQIENEGMTEAETISVDPLQIIDPAETGIEPEHIEDNDDDDDEEEEDADDEEKDDDSKTPEELYCEYVLRFLKFLAKQLKIMFDNILSLGSTSKKRFQLVQLNSNGASRNICFSERECGSTAEVRLWTARCLVLDLVFSGDPSKIVEKSVLRNVRLPIERAAKSLTHSKILVCRKNSGLMGVARQNLKQFVTGLPSNAFDETLDFLEYIGEAANVDSLACISCGILFGIVELSDYFQSFITVTESVFNLNEEWLPVYDGINQEEGVGEDDGKKKRGKKRKMEGYEENLSDHSISKRIRRKDLSEEEQEKLEDIIECFEMFERDMGVGKRLKSHAKESGDGEGGKVVGLEEGDNYIGSSTDALRLLRIRLNQAGVDMPRQNFTGFVERDFFSINLPNLEFKFPKRNGLNHKIAGSSNPFSKNCLKELRTALVELVYHLIPETNQRDLDVQHHNLKIFSLEGLLKKYKILFEVISCAGSLGVSGQFLGKKFERKSLAKGLRYLLEAKLIFSVGVTHRKFVSYSNVTHWVIPIRRNLRDQKVGHVIMRPWITPLGGLSWSTINRLFISLLGQLQRPEVSFDELCSVFAPTLSRVEVIVLVEALVKLKYVTVYRLKERKCTLFSSFKVHENIAHIEYNADTLVDTKDVYVVVSPYTTFLHAQLQSAIYNASRTKFNSDKPGAGERKEENAFSEKGTIKNKIVGKKKRYEKT